MWWPPSPISSTATWRASGSSNPRWAACSIPIADKVLVAVVLLVLCADDILRGGHIWAAIIILSREVLVSGLREYLGELQVSVPVTQIAKWKTTVQLVAIGFLIAGPAGDTLSCPARHQHRHRHAVDRGGPHALHRL